MIALRIRKSKLVALCCLFVFLTGCGDKNTKVADNAASAKQKAATAAQKTESSKVVDTISEVPPAPPQKFVYVVEGRRDPFHQLVLVKRPVVDGQVEQGLMTPLQQYDAQQYKLSAIIIGFGEPRAMVTAPDGKSYILHKGTKVGKNGGKVIRITADVVQIEEIYKDLTDKLMQNVVEIKLPKREGV